VQKVDAGIVTPGQFLDMGQNGLGPFRTIERYQDFAIHNWVILSIPTPFKQVSARADHAHEGCIKID
jgi:hypothetical protein